MRHTHLWLKPDFIFNFTKYAKEQVGLLDLIHSLTNSVSIDRFFSEITINLTNLMFDCINY